MNIPTGSLVVERVRIFERLPGFSLIINLESIAAAIVAVTGMKRLMNISDKMHEEFQGLVPFLVTAIFIGKNSKVFIDGANHAVTVGAIPNGYEFANAIAREINVVPAAGFLG